MRTLSTRFHHEKRRVSIFLDIVNANDVLILDGGSGACFANEAFPRYAARGVDGRQHLDGNDWVQSFVESFEHNAKPSLAEYLQYFITAKPSYRAWLGRGLQESEGVLLVDIL